MQLQLPQCNDDCVHAMIDMQRLIQNLVLQRAYMASSVLLLTHQDAYQAGYAMGELDATCAVQQPCILMPLHGNMKSLNNMHTLTLPVYAM